MVAPQRPLSIKAAGSATDVALRARLARDDADLRAAQRLRYDVFVAELGGAGDHAARRETDRFDAHADHLLLEDPARPAGSRVIGTTRLMNAAQAEAAGGFYSAAEYDLAPLLATGRPLLELGRSCLHPDYRGGAALLQMWQWLGGHVLARDIGILFGVASFHGTDPDALAEPLSFLHHRYRAPDGLRVQVRAEGGVPMDLLPADALDRRRAAAALPSLIKSYLRLGACVGEGAFVDHAFNTTDVCMIVDVARLSPAQVARYGGPA